MEIDEAVKLAGKVDKLRELSSQEQTNLQRFSKESIQSIKAEIDAHIAHNSELLKEALVLEERKRVAQIPLDEEWERLYIEQAKVRNEKEQIAVGSINLRTKEEALTQRESNLVVEEEKITVKRLSADRFVKSSVSHEAQTRSLYAKILKKADESERDFREREKLIQDREKTVGFREIDAQNKETYLQTRDEANRIRELEIESRYQQLLTTEKRVKNNDKRL